MTTDFRALLALLRDHQIDFIVIGGVAASALGSARVTFDLDVVYRRQRANIERLVAALSPLAPYLRGAPPGLPFAFDLRTVERGLNFTLTTSLGDLDLLGEVAGCGRYEDMLPRSASLTIFGVECFCLGLDALIAAKRAAGRPKDFETIAELEALREEIEEYDR